MQIHSDDSILIIGKKKVGKSTLAKILINMITSPLWIFDYCYDYSRFKPRCQVYYNMKYGNINEAITFMKRAYHHRNCFILFDESDNYFTAKNTFLTQFMTTCRNWGIGYIAICKRTKAILPSVRASINYIYAFRITQPEDISYLEDWLEYPKGYLKFLMGLKQGEFIIFDVDNTHDENGNPYHSPKLVYPIDYIRKVEKGNT